MCVLYYIIHRCTHVSASILASSPDLLPLPQIYGWKSYVKNEEGEGLGFQLIIFVQHREAWGWGYIYIIDVVHKAVYMYNVPVHQWYRHMHAGTQHTIYSCMILWTSFDEHTFSLVPRLLSVFWCATLKNWEEPGDKATHDPRMISVIETCSHHAWPHFRWSCTQLVPLPLPWQLMYPANQHVYNDQTHPLCTPLQSLLI